MPVDAANLFELDRSLFKILVEIMVGDMQEPVSRDELRQLQEARLQRLLDGVLPANPFWTHRFSAAGIKAADVRTLDDLRRLPLTEKSDLVRDQLESPPYGSNLTAPRSQFSRLHQTSGTTGQPLRWLDTPESWSWVVSCWRRIYRMVGIAAEDVVAFPFSFGPFLGFWAAFEGACDLGALCLPGGGLTSHARLQMIGDNAVTVVCCTPTYALRLAEVAHDEHIDLSAGSVRSVIVAGEPGGSIPEIRQRIERGWGARVFDHWGMTELGPLAVECPGCPSVLHVLETECIVEVLDPATQRPAAVGEPGELVVTNLGRGASPLFRYRTGDLVAVDSEPCPCGRCLLRLKGGILGRVDDMIIVRGNNVFPSSIEAVLRQFAEVAEYRIDVETRRSMQHVKITVEPQSDVPVDDLAARIGRAVHDRLSFRAEIACVAPGRFRVSR